MAQPAIKWVWSTQAISGCAICTALGIANPGAVDLGVAGLDLVTLGIDFDQRRRSNLVEQEAIGVDQEVVALPRHARRDASVNQIRPSEQVDEAVARGKVNAGPPFRFAHAGIGHSRSS